MSLDSLTVDVINVTLIQEGRMCDGSGLADSTLGQLTTCEPGSPAVGQVVSSLSSHRLCD